MKKNIFLIAGILLSLKLTGQVSYQRIADAGNEPGNWLTYSGNYHSFRFSALNEINKNNVKDLVPVWIYQTRNGNGGFETSPIVVDNIIYITEPPCSVTALDGITGRKLWSYTRELPSELRMLGFGPVNRGLAIIDNSLYFGTLDAYLVCLDASSGSLKWQTRVADNKAGYSITCAPLALDHKIIIGVSGGEAGIRGFLDAYDAQNGKRIWRLYTIPGTGEAGNDTWQGDSWKTGGAPTWITGSYDPELNLLYWGVGNPGPDWNGDARAGDNLYTCSVLAINPDKGTLVWHFQFTAHDTHDWDANQVPVLIDQMVAGKSRKTLATANRNGFYYLLDRTNGKFIAGKAYAKQTWASSLDANGKAKVIPGKEPTEKGNLVYPSLQGATNWFSPSYSPASRLFYVSVREMGSLYFKRETEYKPGEFYLGGGEQLLPGDNAYGAVKALDPLTGDIKWEFRLQSPPWSGLMSTVGGLVFGGSVEGNFYALDADTGKSLWQFQTGGQVVANPVSFNVNGHQRVAIAAGNSLIVFGLPLK